MSYSLSIRSAVSYGFAVGRVRVLEGRLLSNATLERLLDARSFEEQRRIVADTDYGSFLQEARTVGDVETSLDGYIESLLRFVETARLPGAVSEYFRIKFDYQNLKARLKADALGVSVADMLVGHGTVDPSVFAGPLESLPPVFRSLVARTRGTDGSIDRTRVDVVVDTAMAAASLEAARASKCELLVDIALLETDLTNVKTVLRARSLGWPAPEAAESLAGGGRLAPETLMRAYSLSPADMADRLAAHSSLLGLSTEDLGSLERFDVAADNAIMRVARRAHMSATGMEPVIGYVTARRSEVVILRTLLVGKIAGLSPDDLRRRVRDLYV